MKKITKIGMFLLTTGILLGMALYMYRPLKMQDVLNSNSRFPFLFEKENDLKKTTDLTGLKTVLIDLDMGEIIIEEGSKFQVTTETCRTCNYKIQTLYTDNRLTIKDTGSHKFRLRRKKPVPLVHLTVPKETLIDEAIIKTSLGSLKLNQVKIHNLDVTANLGDIEIKNIIANSIKAHADMGDVEIEGKTHSLEMELALGKASFKGESNWLEIENNMGQSEVTLTGNEQDYEVMIDSSLGSISVNDQKQSGINNIYRSNQNMSLDKNVSITNDLGDVKLTFEN